MAYGVTRRTLGSKTGTPRQKRSERKHGHLGKNKRIEGVEVQTSKRAKISIDKQLTKLSSASTKRKANCGSRDGTKELAKQDEGTTRMLVSNNDRYIGESKGKEGAVTQSESIGTNGVSIEGLRGVSVGTNGVSIGGFLGDKINKKRSDKETERYKDPTTKRKSVNMNSGSTDGSKQDAFYQRMSIRANSGTIGVSNNEEAYKGMSEGTNESSIEGDNEETGSKKISSKSIGGSIRASNKGTSSDRMIEGTSNGTIRVSKDQQSNVSASCKRGFVAECTLQGFEEEYGWSTKGSTWSGSKNGRLEDARNAVSGNNQERLLIGGRSTAHVSESSNSNGTLFQMGADNRQNFEERIFGALKEMGEKFDKRLTLLEEHVTVVKKQPPVSAIGTREFVSGVMSPLSSNASLTLANNKKILMKAIEGGIGLGLRALIKKKWYSEIKFVEDDDEIEIAIIEEAIQSKSIGVPDGIHDSEFVSFFRHVVKRELAALRHNTQTLARRNWKGKKRNKKCWSSNCKDE